MTDAHPIQQTIQTVEVSHEQFYTMGSSRVTRIEACTKPGLHCDIPYFRVWAGDHCLAEFCQHNIVGVYFAREEANG